MTSIVLRAVPSTLLSRDVSVTIDAPEWRLTPKALYATLFPREPLVQLVNEEGRGMQRTDDTTNLLADATDTQPLLIRFTWSADPGVLVSLLYRVGESDHQTVEARAILENRVSEEKMEFPLPAKRYQYMPDYYMMLNEDLFADVESKDVHVFANGARIDIVPAGVISTPRVGDDDDNVSITFAAGSSSTFNEFLLGKRVSQAGHTIVVDLYTPLSITRARVASLLSSAMDKARTQSCHTVLVRLPRPGAATYDTYQRLAHAAGFTPNPDGTLMRKFLLDPTPSAASCAKVLRVSMGELIDVYPELLGDVQSMCNVMARMEEQEFGERYAYVMFPAAQRAFPCAAAFVDVRHYLLSSDDSSDSDSDSDGAGDANVEWYVAYLCSNIKGSGKALLLHILAEARLHSVRFVTISPVNTTVCRHYLSWWSPSVFDEIENLITYVTWESPPPSPTTSKRPRVGSSPSDEVASGGRRRQRNTTTRQRRPRRSRPRPRTIAHRR